MVNRLIAGAATFSRETFAEHADLFADLSQGQAPQTLLITCADSRIDPSLIFATLPGDIFVIRNAGNIVPILDADGSSADGTAASIDYAVAVLGVKHIVVCGHSSCGAMSGLADPASVSALTSIQRWLAHSESLRADGTDDLDDLIERNVALQLDHLATYPTVRAALDADAIELHGWVYDIATGVVQTHHRSN